MLEVIVGKPSPITVRVALEVMGLAASECILIGDRLETDIRMGREAVVEDGPSHNRRDRRKDHGGPSRPSKSYFF
jgi:FMN phosphatase YigB (HAD superfamily)